MKLESPSRRSSELEEEPTGASSPPPGEDPSAPAVAPVDLGPAALASVAEEIRRAQPLAPAPTGLLLYDVDPEHLQVQWLIAPGDLARARHAFPPASSPRLRVVLKRLDAGGDAREVAVIDRKADESNLEDQAVIGVDAAEADYRAELGLASAEGGWLLLARSNQVRPPRPAIEPAHARTEPLAVEDAEVEPALALHGVPLEPVFPMPGLGPAAGASRSRSTEALVLWEGVSRAVLGMAEAGPGAARAEDRGGIGPGAWAELPPPLLPSTPAGGAGDGIAAADFYDPRAALSSRELAARLTGAAELELHAELRVWGRAAPGRLIDVFGLPLRVDADGRFLLRLPVEDPESIARALAVADSPMAGPEEA